MTNLFSYLRRRKNLNGTTMISFPNAKINIGLNVIGKRPNGYHDIETVFCPVGLRDALEFRAANGKTSLRISGKSVDGEMENNLTVRALRLMQRDFHVPELEICLHKCIPMGAGLGGGSADAAFTLKMLNEIFSLGLGPEQLAEHAARIGSDVPFFIYNRPMLAIGRGEILVPIENPVPEGFKIGVVTPGIPVSTAEAYSGAVPSMPETRLRDLIETLPLEQWKGRIINDFENSVFKKHPALKAIKDSLYEAGAVYASMSGSGSALYGIFAE